MKRVLSLLTASALVIVLSAGVMRDDVPETEYLNLGKQKQFDCVGQVYIDNAPKGSAVLIGKRYVLSAAHIYNTYTFRPDTLNKEGQMVIVNTVTSTKKIDPINCTFDFKGKKYQAKSMSIYADLKGKEEYDLILIELTEDVKGITPAKLNRDTNELGSDIIGVGFGASGYGGKPEKIERKQLKIAGENVIDSLGGPQFAGKSTLLICDFDSPTNPNLNRIGSKMPRRLEYTVGGGDSGGGMFRLRKGQWELVGICKGSEGVVRNIMANYGYYGSLMTFSRVSIFYDWIAKSVI